VNIVLTPSLERTARQGVRSSSVKKNIYRSLAGLVVASGLALSFFVALASDLPKPQEAFLAGVAGLLMTIGGYFGSSADHKQETKDLNEKHAQALKALNDEHAQELRAHNEKHTKEKNALIADLTAKGEGYLINQYAQDTIRIAISQDMLNDLEAHAHSQPPNVPAIVSLLKSNKGVHLIGFYEKAGDLLSREEGVEILRKFVLHLDQVINSSSYIPDALRLKHEELKKLLDSAISTGRTAAANDTPEAASSTGSGSNPERWTTSKKSSG
jgi:hypothetical protein